MKVGVVTEIKADEYRVALTPAGARELALHGHEVLVERGAGTGSAFADADYEAAGATPAVDCEDVWGEAELLLKVKEPLAEEFPRIRAGQTLFTYLHLAPAPAADAGADGVGRDVHRLRDGRDRRPQAAAARADERGGRPAGAADGRDEPREAEGRPRHPARRRARRAAGEGGRAGRRHRRLQRGADRGRHAGRRVGARALRRPYARARHDARRPHHALDLEPPRGRGGDRRRRPRDRRGTGARREGAAPRDARHARPDEARRRAGRRRDRPGRLLRDVAADHALRPGLRGRRRRPLLRREHAGRRADHVHEGPHERDAAVRGADRALRRASRRCVARGRSPAA